MNRIAQNLLLGLLSGLLVWGVTRLSAPQDQSAPQPAPSPVPAPQPEPRPDPDRRRPLRPWRDEEPSLQLGPASAVAQSLGAEPLGPGGLEPQIDYPDPQWMKNIGSKRDGAGMCVFTSFEHAARWAGLEEFRGFRDWCAERYPGGGYPEKLAKLIQAYCSAKEIPSERFSLDRDVIQYEGPSPELLETALRQGLLPCCTLYYSPRYGRGRIYHMVNCAHFDGQNAAILDNNFQPLEWASREETLRRVKLDGKLWIVVLLKPGPPPLPRPARTAPN